ncbi:hypothetical protein AVEN_164092-1 [Araneus ventricosus]|uniref:Uncharacterized protein n=1 Tax=Araneus ventricosus TaxID=182803 RepID=A0A4Y2KQY9_ARAVE|nr:hypothetical protein AVEN_164092-1 [Araneus ventricosus]
MRSRRLNKRVLAHGRGYSDEGAWVPPPVIVRTTFGRGRAVARFRKKNLSNISNEVLRACKSHPLQKRIRLEGMRRHGSVMPGEGGTHS